MKNDLSNTATALVTELPDSVRIPLHSLQADLGYLIGRVIADGSCGPMIVKSMRESLDQIEASLLAKPVAWAQRMPPFKIEDASHLASVISRHEGPEHKYPLYAAPSGDVRAAVIEECRKMVLGAQYANPCGPEESAWNAACDHIEEGFPALSQAPATDGGQHG